ncbi:MAG: toprim domain-containing protein [Candidatus Gastranaerophilaceae bacterium]
MAKPKKFNEIKQFNNKNNIKKYLQDNPDKLREFFVDKGFDFDDMEFDIDSDFVCCPFCRDNGYHGQVNYNEEKDTHNIYCYKCSEINNNGRAYTPWDYLTKVYRVNQGGLSFLDAVISLYNSPEDFTKAYEGHAVERNQKIIIPREDKQQELIDNIYNNCNGDILPFIDELYSQCTFEEIEPYINLYNNIPDTVASVEWDDPDDQNVQIFGLSKLPIKVITRNAFDKFVSETEDTGHIRNLFSNGTYFLYMIPTVTPSGKIVQIAFRIVDGEPSEYKPKVKKVKARSENINIPTMFGFHNFTGFKRGMPIVLVEGEKDAIAMQTIYPYTLAMGRNTLGNSIKYLKYLTDKFIIIPDNDGAGLNGYEKIKKDMDRYGLKLKRISINNPKLKDVADVYTKGSWESIRKIMTKLKAKFNIN